MSMKVTEQTMTLWNGDVKYLVGHDSVARFYKDEMEFYKEFSPPLPMPFDINQANDVSNQAELEPSDSFVRKAEPTKYGARGDE